MILPLKGQMQASGSCGWQLDFTVCPLLSIAVQPLQPKATLAFAGVSSNVPLKSTAIILTRRSIFFFISKSLFLSSQRRDDDGRCLKTLKLLLDPVLRDAHRSCFLFRWSLCGCCNALTTVFDNRSTQGTKAGIDRRNLAIRRGPVSAAIDCCAACAAETCDYMIGSNQQCGAQEHSDKTHQQKHLLHIEVSLSARLNGESIETFPKCRTYGKPRLL